VIDGPCGAHAEPGRETVEHFWLRP
jgi:hypothetical protein